jgi:hypothetical protein
MNTIRTRLQPGSPWIHDGTDARLPDRPSTFRRPRALAPARPSPSPSPAMGVEVSELQGDTLFDRLFGASPSPAPTPP